jgi:hypothetical protein
MPAGDISADLQEAQTAESTNTIGGTGAPIVTINGPGQMSTPLIVGGVLALVVFLGVVFYATRRR